MQCSPPAALMDRPGRGKGKPRSIRGLQWSIGVAHLITVESIVAAPGRGVVGGPGGTVKYASSGRWVNAPDSGPTAATAATATSSNVPPPTPSGSTDPEREPERVARRSPDILVFSGVS